jgi:hypothetical protein
MLENNYPQQFKPLVLGTFVFSCPTQTQFFHSCIFRIRYPSHKFRVFPPSRLKSGHSQLPRSVVAKVYYLLLAKLGVAENWRIN